MFVVTKDTLVAEVLERVPGARELLISYGFTPLANPVMRKSMTPHVKLETGCRVHTIDLEALLRDLNRLVEEGAVEGPAESVVKQPAETTAATPGPKLPAQIDAARVLMALRDCHDPEIPANIVDLGLVCDVKIDGDRVAIKMTLTSPDCAGAGQVVSDMSEVLSRLGARGVEVELVREPPWSRSRVTPAARAVLGWD
jgi:metal-sulfur cluster biosynthetic enzyme